MLASAAEKGPASMALDPGRYAGLSEFRYALRRFLAASEAISKEGGVTQQQYQAMLAIGAWSPRPMAIKDLAEQLQLTHHAAVQLIDRMEKLRLAERCASEEDRRVVLLTLTAEGAVLLERLAAQHLEELQRQEPLITRSLARIRRAKG
jgi:DNA-binding MarR family transcriptional regulator